MEKMITTSYFSILAERDAALHERNLAVAERKAALAARDMALVQRDAATVERDSAIMERNNVIAALQYQDSVINNNLAHGGVNALHDHSEHVVHHLPHLAEEAYSPKEMSTVGAFPSVLSQNSKERKAKQRKEIKGATSKKGKRQVEEDLSKQVTIASWKDVQNSGTKCDDLNRQFDIMKPEWKDYLGLNRVDFDESTMTVPVCSCTGVVQQCYKWGNGGWQSACCTTTMSMYPLPQMPDKPQSRVCGRKMSGSAFTKLMSRLAAEGHDMSTPLDLKDHWAKHGTNRYSIIK